MRGLLAPRGRVTDRHERVAVARELLRADTAHAGQLGEARRLAPRDLGERRVVQDHVRGHALGAGFVAAPGLQAFEDSEGRGVQPLKSACPHARPCRRGAFGPAACDRTPHLDVLLALQHRTARVGELERAVRGVVDVH